MDIEYLYGIKNYCGVMEKIHKLYEHMITSNMSFNESNDVLVFEILKEDILNIIDKFFVIFPFDATLEKIKNNSGILMLKSKSLILEERFKNLEKYFIRKRYIKNKVDTTYIELEDINMLSIIRIVRNKREHELHNIRLNYNWRSKKNITFIYNYKTEELKIDLNLIKNIIIVLDGIFNELIVEIKKDGILDIVDNKWEKYYSNINFCLSGEEI